jgi:hypothetical protein
MSKSQAIAAVTAVLAHVVNKSTGETVETGRPKSPDGANNGESKVNICLYQVTPNAAWRNEDLATRDSDGKLRKRPQLALDLHYLFSFYGDEMTLKPQLMMGEVMRDLHAGALLTPSIIKKVSVDASKNKQVIIDSELDKSIHSIKVTLAALSLDELTKIWSIFFQTPYALSVAYQATVVLIEKDVPTEEALPVRERGVYGVPLVQPDVQRITAQTEAGTNPQGIIKADAIILIQGKNLQAEETTVLIDGLRVVLASVGDREIAVQRPLELIAEDGTRIPFSLRAGAHALQVMHGMVLGGLSSPEPHRIIESNPVAFLLNPMIQLANVTDKVRNQQGLFSANVALTFNPKVTKPQRVWILLKETPEPADRPPRASRFMAPKDNGITGLAEDTNTVTFPVKDVAAGDYLLLAHVDGGESLPVELGEFKVVV